MTITKEVSMQLTETIYEYEVPNNTELGQMFSELQSIPQKAELIGFRCADDNDDFPLVLIFKEILRVASK